jgi:hypothetical protein
MEPRRDVAWPLIGANALRVGGTPGAEIGPYTEDSQARLYVGVDVLDQGPLPRRSLKL